MRSKHSKKHDKVGSDPVAVHEFGGKGDFGAPANNVVERAYVSGETKHNDPGASLSRMKFGDESRESGVGANESGPGSGSGGDIDTDFVGLGGSGLAQTGPDDRTEGPDMMTSA